MTREQAKANLIAMGIEAPTDDQVTNYLNQVNGAIQKEKARADQYKADADKVKDLQKQLEDMQNANLTDIEKANKAAADAQAEIENLKNQIAMTEKRADAMKNLANMGITGEEAESLINENGEISDFEALGKVLAAQKEAAATAKEKEIANNSGNPGGGDGSKNGGDDKPEDVKIAEAISFGNSAKAEDKDYYVK